MRRAIVLILAAVLALPSLAHTDVASVCPTLGPGVNLYGHFIQEQHVKGLTAPLKTEGSFVVAPDLGIIWRSEQPVRSITVITAAGMRRFVNGDEVQRLSSARAPAFTHVYELLDRAMMGDWSLIEKDFTVEYTGDRQAWRVALAPLRSAGPLVARLTSVVLTGDGRIETVDINRVNGDSEHVAFLNQLVSKTPLADPDAHLLHDKWE